MWRDKNQDLNQIDLFIKSLKDFQRFKQEKWERIDDKAQMANPPGTPGEDWIQPPDENGVSHELESDPHYTSLKKEIIQLLPVLKQIAKFLHFDEHHDFDWINFNSPLIGNDALVDGLDMAKRLKGACENNSYVFQNLVNLFQSSKK